MYGEGELYEGFCDLKSQHVSKTRGPNEVNEKGIQGFTIFCGLDVDSSGAAEHDTINTVTIYVRQYVIYPKKQRFITTSYDERTDLNSLCH